MKRHLPAIAYSIIVSLVLATVLFVIQYSNATFVMKGAFFACFFIVYTVAIFFMKNDHIVYLLIFMSFLDIPIVKLHTSTTSLLIAMAFLVFVIRYLVDNNKSAGLYSAFRERSITLPLFLVLGSYTLSLVFVRNDIGEHFMMYQGVVCAAIIAFMITFVIQEGDQIRTINKIMLAVLILNLMFSFVFLVFPGIDLIRAKLFSMVAFSDESASRLQGLSFRGEGYGEYLMIAGLWLLSLLWRGVFNRGKVMLWILMACTIVALIMTRSRGPVILFLLGTVVLIASSGSVSISKKILAIASIFLVCAGSLLALHKYTKDITLIDRFNEFTERRNVGYIPETRYYTWMPAFQQARKHEFLGVGPSYAPYVLEGNWEEIVSDKASGDTTTWPHNIILIVLCTIGLYGLLSYVLLVYRTIGLRKVFRSLDSNLASCYFAYSLGFIMFLIEGQKYDGVLRHPGSSFYFIFILIALLFSSENMVEIGHSGEECKPLPH